jgi:hypothetical protein
VLSVTRSLCERHGALSGAYPLSAASAPRSGPGRDLSVPSGAMKSPQGHAATWAVCAAAILASFPLVRRLRDDVD